MLRLDPADAARGTRRCMATAASVMAASVAGPSSGSASTREKRCVAFDLDQVEAAGRIDHLLEQERRGRLRVSEDAAVELHVLRVAADVGYQEQRTPGRHGWTLTGRDRLGGCDGAHSRLRQREQLIGDTKHVTTHGNGRERRGSRAWADEAVRRIEADANRSADTHLHAFPLPADWGIDLYLKDESVHPTGSLKHRLARSLFLYGLCNGWITRAARRSSRPPAARRPSPRRTSRGSSACRSSPSCRPPPAPRRSR